MVAAHILPEPLPITIQVSSNLFDTDTDTARRLRDGVNIFTFASNVLPHPGGPANSIPGGLLRPRALNASGLRTGACMEMKKKIYTS